LVAEIFSQSAAADGEDRNQQPKAQGESAGTGSPVDKMLCHQSARQGESKKRREIDPIMQEVLRDHQRVLPAMDARVAVGVGIEEPAWSRLIAGAAGQAGVRPGVATRSCSFLNLTPGIGWPLS
jgi:hypothetical protein